MAILPDQILPTGVNVIDVASSLAGQSVAISSLGVDTAIPIKIAPKGNAPVALAGTLSSYLVPTAVSTDAATTLTTAAVLGGLIVRSGATAGRTDTLPTAAQLVTAVGNFLVIGSVIEFDVRNTSGQTITVAVGTGITSAAGNTLTIATLSTRKFVLVFTGVATGSESATLYSTAVSLH